MPLDPSGRDEVAASGRRLAGMVQPGEEVHFLTTPTRRTKDTADVIRETMQEVLGAQAGLLVPREEWAIRNPDLFLAGRRVEMMSTPEAVAAQIPEAGLAPAVVDGHPFFHHFFRSPDRIGYWLGHPDPPGEDPVAVARRVVAFGESLLYVAPPRPRRYVCVTHSPVLRAVLIRFFHHDPGEPEWAEALDLVLDESGSSLVFRDRRVALRP